MQKHILIVDDHAMVRRGIATTIINELQDFQAVCDEAAEGVDALEKAANTPYNLVILDISLPGMDGLDLLARLKALLPAAAFLIVSMHPEDLYGVKSLQAGADGYITKSQVADELLTAVARVLRGERYLSRYLADILIGGNIPAEPAASQKTDNRLSERERQVMELLSTGKNIKSVASELDINLKTVSTYKKRIFTKMGFTSDAQMILHFSRLHSNQ